ncbi:ADP-heptose:LPS heptosyltransferase [Sphingopyxis panaciterrae]|uniref:glycosyltransferase family 9 protein n=1 Tax=Sphingopyxis panaciterrae TaxID=363841 RepID=UPI0014232E1C|nr:glycosyltransferase family 9 protein [Sphingopyxis panaciterrae]NIJ38728.1 ADP-heptose:LPS heptosyltransferase [Sphingopyxis panaciterrae]
MAEIARKPSVPVAGNVALPARVLSENIVIRRILVVKLDHIGDFFVSVEALCRLRASWPQAHITLICDPTNYDLAQALGIFDDVLKYRFFDEGFEKKNETIYGSEFDPRCAGVAELGLSSYDVAIDLRHDFDTRPCLTYVSATFRVGYAKAGDRPPDAPILDLALAEIPPDGPEQLHAATRVNMLVALMVDTFVTRPMRQISRLVDSTWAGRPFEGRRYMVIAPCARSVNRTWPLQNFVALAKRIVASYDFAIVAVGSATERESAALFCETFTPETCVNLAGTSLPDLPNLVAGASLYIGNDTGGTHLAALLGVPTLCVYGGVSDPRVWQPVGSDVAIVHSRTPCSYCHINVKEDCPHSQRCMSEIDVDRAFKQACRLLGGVNIHENKNPFR